MSGTLISISDGASLNPNKVFHGRLENAFSRVFLPYFYVGSLEKAQSGWASRHLTPLFPRSLRNAIVEGGGKYMRLQRVYSLKFGI